MGADKKVVSDQHFVFFNNLRSPPDGAIEHTGDNTTGDGDGDDEIIKVDLAAAPASIDSIVFPPSRSTTRTTAASRSARSAMPTFVW